MTRKIISQNEFYYSGFQVMAEYDATQGGLNQADIRQYFLIMLEKLLPKVVNKLAEKPFEAISKLHLEPIQWEALIRCKKDIEELLTVTPERLPNYREDLPSMLWASFPIFHKFFYEWANKYNLKDEWLVKHFFEVLVFWVNNPKVKGKYLGGFFISPAFFVVQDDWHFNDGTKMRFDFQFPAFRFNEVNKTDYRKAIQIAFKKSLNEYLNKVDNFALESGYKSNPKKKKLERHLEWLILYQVKRKTYRQIAELCQDEKGIDEAAINQAVHKIADILEINLREGSKRGRKRLRP